MSNEDLNKSDIWNYYDNPCVIINNSFPDGKTQRRQRRAKAIRKRKGRI